MSEASTDGSFSLAAAFPDLGPNLGPLSRWLSRMVLSRIHIGRLTIVSPSGMRLSHGTDNRAEGVLILRRWRTLRRLLFQGDIAAAEAFIDGDWDSPDLAALIELAGLNMPTLSETFDANWLQRLRNRIRHRLNANTRRGSRRNIRHHYDLSNEFYRRWLDRGMSYSSAIFSSPDETLEDAQTAKQQRVIELIEAKRGQQVLEIGCGWGGLAEQLVQMVGCHVTGVTLSSAQLEYATARQSEAVQSGNPNLRLQDYRDVRGVFDRVVSIEMMEAVGEAY